MGEFNGEFKVVVEADYGPFSLNQDEKWFSTAILKLASSLNKINYEQIDEAVKSASEIYENIDIKTLSIEQKAMLGDALMLGDNPSAGYEVLLDAAKSVSETNRGYYCWLAWRAGLSAWLAGKDSDAKIVFNDILNGFDGKEMTKEKWEYSQWVAAWFLEKADDKELLDFFAKQGASSEDDPHFLFGERFLKQKKYEDAKKAYERCIEIAKKSGDNFPANRAKWRLKQMEGREKANK